MKRSTMVLVALLLLPAIPPASADSRTAKAVCIVSQPMADEACAVGNVETDVTCFGGGSTYECRITAHLTLDLQGPDTCARIQSTAAPNRSMQLCTSFEHERALAEPETLLYRNIGREGRSVVNEHEVCVGFWLGAVAGARSQMTCRTWSSVEYLPPSPKGGFDEFIDHRIGTVNHAQRVAEHTEQPAGLDTDDPSSEFTCGNRIQDACVAGRLHYMAPACQSPPGARSCGVSYWFEINHDQAWPKGALDRESCASMTTDQFDAWGTRCIEPGETRSVLGPFNVTYEDVPAGGAAVPVQAQLCLGTPPPVFHSHCVTWTAATVVLPSAADA